MPAARPAALVAAATVTLLVAAPAAQGQEPGSPPVAATGLPTVDSGHRPGPDALYLPPPRAPQLENTGPWQAEPILISGTSAYRDGEWLYQDFLFDDHGAAGIPGRADPYGPATNLYSPPGGTFHYPTDPVYAHNAADLVELRIRPLPDATAFRVTLNTLADPDRVAFTIALGDAVADADWPHGAGVRSPASLFLTVTGPVAELRQADTGDEVEPAPTAAVDLERRQIDVRIPHAAWDPGRDQVRVTVGVGLWDPDAGRYLAPQPGSATTEVPGGGDLRGTAIVNVGPRYDEPLPTIAGYTMVDTAAGARALAPWWRDRQQSLQLALGDLAPFAAEVDFAKLRAGTDDDSRIPTSGPMNRIFASRYVFGQGLEPDNVCFGITSGINLGADCIGRYVGQLQPYAIYVPDTPPPATGYGLTLLLHSLSANHNQYLGSNNQRQLGDRGTIVITPEGRGPDGFYAGVPEADTFEVWADVARHYPLDPTWVTSSGYSMGGFGTYRLMARYPDLFARGFPVVGRPGSALDQLVSLRNTPIMAWNATGDELVNVADAEEAHRALVDAEVPHEYWQFPTADHLTLAANDEYQPGADFLGDHRVDRDPPTVAYVVDPRENSRDVVADHAYWLSGLTVRDPEAAPTGTIEVHSHGFGVAPRGATPAAPGAGVLTGGQNQAMPYVTRGMEGVPGDDVAAADVLTVTARNVARVTIDPARARVTCAARIDVDSDGPLAVELAGCTDRGAAAAAPEVAVEADEIRPAPGALPATGGGGGMLAVACLAGAIVAGRVRR